MTLPAFAAEHFAVVPLLLSTDISCRRDTPVYTHPFNGPFSRTTRVGRYQKGKTNLDFTEARDSEWQWQWRDTQQQTRCTRLLLLTDGTDRRTKKQTLDRLIVPSLHTMRAVSTRSLKKLNKYSTPNLGRFQISQQHDERNSQMQHGHDRQKVT